jgi:hypothetical protein
MDSPAPDRDNPPELDMDLPVDRVPPAEKSWLNEIVDQLESDPQECWQAIESLEGVEPELRLSIVDELSGLGSRPGAEMLLRLLSSARDLATRAAARSALERMDVEARPPVWLAPAPPFAVDREARSGGWSGGDERSLLVPLQDQRSRPRLTRSLVTPVDGQGRGSIVVSVNQRDKRRTAAFLCDVRLGICDVVGEVEPESPRAGGLIDSLDQEPEGECARDIPELALGLLAGSLMLCGPNVPPPVRDWLLGTLGPGFQPAGLPATIPGLDPSSLAQAEMPARAVAVLDACPSWLDSSPLTFELAEEIWLRERRTAADPERDAGAYRFLFEHRLIHCLELYQRMLLWMAWLWTCSGQTELSKSAWALAAQLADEQYAVPSHPFAVELTTRSLEAARVRLETKASRSSGAGA